jgi:hypothetical protein
VAGLAVVHDEEPPHFDASKVVFAEEGPDRFHDLMHSVWRCHDRRLHLSRAWEYRWEPELRRQTLCRVGRHRITKSWRRSPPTRLQPAGPWQFTWRCADCGHAPPLIAPPEDNDE